MPGVPHQVPPSTPRTRTLWDSQRRGAAGSGGGTGPAELPDVPAGVRPWADPAGRRQPPRSVPGRKRRRHGVVSAGVARAALTRWAASLPANSRSQMCSSARAGPVSLHVDTETLASCAFLMFVLGLICRSKIRKLTAQSQAGELKPIRATDAVGPASGRADGPGAARLPDREDRCAWVTSHHCFNSGSELVHRAAAHTCREVRTLSLCRGRVCAPKFAC